jgi:hypothetical protein
MNYSITWTRDIDAASWFTILARLLSCRLHFILWLFKIIGVLEPAMEPKITGS